MVEVELEHTQISAVQEAKGAASAFIYTDEFIPPWLRLTHEHICIHEAHQRHTHSHKHTWCFEPQEARDLALALLLLLVRQQLVDELPDHLFGRSVEHREHIHDQGVNDPVEKGSEVQGQRSAGCCRGHFHRHRTRTVFPIMSLQEAIDNAGKCSSTKTHRT